MIISFFFFCKQQAMSIKLELDNSLQWLVVFSPLSFSSISNRVNVWVNIASIPLSKSDCKLLTYYQGYSLICHSSLLADLGLNNEFIGEVSNLPAFVNGALVETCEGIKKMAFEFSVLVERYFNTLISTQSTLSLFHSPTNNKLPTQQEVSASKAEGFSVIAKLVNKNAKVANITNFFHSNQVFTNHISVRQIFATLKVKRKKINTINS